MRNSPALHMAPPAIHPYLVRHTLAAAGLPAQGDGGWADGRPPYEEGCRDKTLGWLRAAASSRCHARGRNVAPRPPTANSSAPRDPGVRPVVLHSDAVTHTGSDTPRRKPRTQGAGGLRYSVVGSTRPGPERRVCGASCCASRVAPDFTSPCSSYNSSSSSSSSISSSSSV